jgi:hypothetical protein
VPERERSCLRVKVTDYLTSKKGHNGPLFPRSICLSSDHDHDEDKIFTTVEVPPSPFSSSYTNPSKR